MILMKGNVERVVENEAQIRKLMEDGFLPLDPIPGKEDEKPLNLGRLKVDELKALAKEQGIEGASSLTKEELLAVLKDVAG